MIDINKIIETLADIEHQRWSNWQKYLHSKCKRDKNDNLIIPANYVKNLEKLIKTNYKDLTEKEKNSDREEVKVFLDILKNNGYILLNMNKKDIDKLDRYKNILIRIIEKYWNTRKFLYKHQELRIWKMIHKEFPNIFILNGHYIDIFNLKKYNKTRYK